MPQKVQRIAPGLLSFLGLKGTGQNPTELGELLSPVVDLTPFYHAIDLLTANASTAGLNTVGQSTLIEVPAGETWRVMAAGYIATNLTAAGICHISILYQPPGTGNVVPITKPIRYVVGAAGTERHDVGYWFPTPFIAPTGSQFIMLLEESTGAGTMSLNARVAYQKLLS